MKKKRILYWSIVLFPIVVLISVNETVRLISNEKGYIKQGVIAINTAESQKGECSWSCHNSTTFCKENHVKLAKPYVDKIDPIYFGVIESLKSTGNYGLANVLFLVVLLPLTMYLLLIKSVNIQSEIFKFKKGE